jgi:hypothetical protein
MVAMATRLATCVRSPNDISYADILWENAWDPDYDHDGKFPSGRSCPRSCVAGDSYGSSNEVTIYYVSGHDPGSSSSAPSVHRGAPAEQSATIADQGWVIEQFTSTGGTTIQLSKSFRVGTPEVYVNGLRQDPSGYTEYELEGAIVLDSPLPVGAAITVKYYANGQAI